MEAIEKEYDTKIDSKNRFTIRGAKYAYYHVKEYSDGHIELLPRVLAEPEEISERTLEMMDKSVKELKSGKVSNPIDIKKYMDNK